MRLRTTRAIGIVLLTGTTALGACGGDDGGPNLADDPASTASSSLAPTTTGSVTTVAAGPTTVVSTTPPGTDLGQPTLDGASTVSTNGLDTVVFGMSITQAEKAAGTRLLPDDSIPAGVGCVVLKPESGPAGIAFTVTAGTIERVDIGTPATTRTRSGAGIGTTIAQLQTLFGDRLVPNGTTYVFTPIDPADAAFRVIFETDGTSVTGFRAGRVPQVEPPSPC